MSRTATAMSNPLDCFIVASGARNNSTVRRELEQLISKSRLVSYSAYESFGQANALTETLRECKWSYDATSFRAHRMARTKTGNCLGLACLFGALLEMCGNDVRYEIVVGPHGWQRAAEQKVLDRLMSGDAFDFDRPLLPTMRAGGEPLLFSTVEHPRLILRHDDEDCRFETTILNQQEPSEISGEWVREVSYRQLLGLVYFERANQELNSARPDFGKTDDLINLAEHYDPHNREIWTARIELALKTGDVEEYEVAKNAYLEIEGDDSQYYLHRHYLTQDTAPLHLALCGNPTDMRAWPLQHVVREFDFRSQRANFAVAAQCIARSGVLDLKEFYRSQTALLRELFPNEANQLLA